MADAAAAAPTIAAAAAAEQPDAMAAAAADTAAELSPPRALVSGPYSRAAIPLSTMLANSASPRKQSTVSLNTEEIILNQQMLRIAEDLEDGPYVHRRSAELWDEWTRVLTTWKPVPAESRDRRIKYLIREGVPNPLRPKVRFPWRVSSSARVCCCEFC